MNSKRLILTISATLVLVGCQGGPAVSSIAHRCVPPAYPALRVSPMTVRREVTSTTSDEIEKVRASYLELFLSSRGDGSHATGKWSLRQLGERYMFECSGAPNDYEVEFGCILLTPSNKGTSILRIWDITEGGVGCLSLLEIPVEDN
jgi:hypothetical protein